MMSSHLVFQWNKAHKPIFYFAGILAFGYSGAIGHSKNVGIDCNGGHPEGSVQNNVGSLSTYSRQCLKCFSILRNVPVVLIQKDATSLKQVLGFGIE